MTDVGHESVSPPVGLRQRKRLQTKARIAEVGLRLFLERGFEATTLDAIAEASDIARRTFFHYFDSKEAILASIQDKAEDGMRRAILAASADRPAFDVVCDAMIAMIANFDSREARAIDGLLRSTEALRARKQANYEKQERLVFATLREKWPSPATNQKLRLVSMVCIGALRLAVETWNAETDGRPLQVHLQSMLAALRNDLTG